MKAKLIRTDADGCKTYDGCTECGGKDGHEARCSSRQITGRSARTVQDPRFRDGAFVGDDSIDPRVEHGRITMMLAEIPRRISAGGEDEREMGRLADQLIADRNMLPV